MKTRQFYCWPYFDVSRLTLGGDPEFELSSGQRADETPIGDSLRAPIGADGAGGPVEFRPEPSETPEGLVENFRNLLKEFADKFYIELNCGQNYACGGHIHLGFEFQTQEGRSFGFRELPSWESRKLTEQIVDALDLFLGGPSSLLNQPSRRRSGYGRLGDWEWKVWGFEYRTPPAVIYSRRDLLTIALKIVRGVVNAVCRKDRKFWRIQGQDHRGVFVPLAQEYVRVVGLTQTEAEIWILSCLKPVLREMAGEQQEEEEEYVLAAWEIVPKTESEERSRSEFEAYEEKEDEEEESEDWEYWYYRLAPIPRRGTRILVNDWGGGQETVIELNDDWSTEAVEYLMSVRQMLVEQYAVDLNRHLCWVSRIVLYGLSSSRRIDRNQITIPAPDWGEIGLYDPAVVGDRPLPYSVFSTDDEGRSVYCIGLSPDLRFVEDRYDRREETAGDLCNALYNVMLAICQFVATHELDIEQIREYLNRDLYRTVDGAIQFESGTANTRFLISGEADERLISFLRSVDLRCEYYPSRAFADGRMSRLCDEDGRLVFPFRIALRESDVNDTSVFLLGNFTVNGARKIDGARYSLVSVSAPSPDGLRAVHIPISRDISPEGSVIIITNPSRFLQDRFGTVSSPALRMIIGDLLYDQARLPEIRS